MDSVSLKKTHKVLNVLILIVFLALVGAVALVTKNAFIPGIGKIFNYCIFFSFERPWDYKTILVLIIGLLLVAYLIVWAIKHYKHGILSMLSPILALALYGIVLAAYRWRFSLDFFVKNDSTKALTCVIFFLLVDLVILILINAVVSFKVSLVIMDEEDAAFEEEEKATETVSIDHVSVVDDAEQVEEAKTEEVVNEEPVNETAEPKEKKKYDTLDPTVYGEIIRRTFMEKFDALDEDMKAKYLEIRRELLSYEGVRSRISKHCDSYRIKKDILVKINIQGKTLKVFFALDPHEYDGTTYPIIDVSSKKIYQEVPVLLKVKSSLSVKRAKALISDVMESHGIEKSEDPSEEAMEMRLDLEIVRRSFVEKLTKAPNEVKEKYDEIKSYLLSYGVKSRISAACDSYRYKKDLFAKITIQGKTLKLFIAIDPKAFADTKIPVIDASNKKSYANVPTLLKVKSPLSVKRAKKIIDRLMEEKGLTQGTVVAHSHANDLKKAKN